MAMGVCGGSLSKEFLEPLRIIGEALLHDCPVLGQDCDLRVAFVQVNAHVYHLLGLLSQEISGRL